MGGENRVITATTNAEVLLPNSFFAPFEAVTARLRTAPAGSTIAAFAPAQSSMTISVGAVDDRTHSDPEPHHRGKAHAAHRHVASGFVAAGRGRGMGRRERPAAAAQRARAGPRGHTRRRGVGRDASGAHLQAERRASAGSRATALSWWGRSRSLPMPAPCVCRRSCSLAVAD